MLRTGGYLNNKLGKLGIKQFMKHRDKQSELCGNGSVPTAS